MHPNQFGRPKTNVQMFIADKLRLMLVQRNLQWAVMRLRADYEYL